MILKVEGAAEFWFQERASSLWQAEGVTEAGHPAFTDHSHDCRADILAESSFDNQIDSYGGEYD